MHKPTAHPPIVVAMKIAVIVALKAAPAAVVQIAPPKLDHPVGRAGMAAANVAEAKLVVLVAVDQKPDQNREAPVVKDARKVDPMLAPNVAAQAEVVLMRPPNHAALVVKARLKLDEMAVQNVDAVNVARKLGRMPPDDMAPMPDRIAHSLRAVLKSPNEVLNAAVPTLELDQVAINTQTLGAHRHIEVVSAAVL